MQQQSTHFLLILIIKCKTWQAPLSVNLHTTILHFHLWVLPKFIIYPIQIILEEKSKVFSIIKISCMLLFLILIKFH